MPAVALQVVTSRLWQEQHFGVEGHSANESNRKGEMGDGEAWAGMEEGRRGSLMRQQTRGRGTKVCMAMKNREGWHILK